MSHGLTIAQTLMHQIGPELAEIETIIQQEIDSWAIQFFDDEMIHMLYQASPSRWVMSYELDAPEISNQAEIYAAMLCTNLLYQGVAPLKVALSKPGGVLLLIGEFQLTEASLDELQMLIQQFLMYAAHISDQISLLGEGGPKDKVVSDFSPQVNAHILA